MDGFSIIVPFLNEEDGITLFMQTLDEHQTKVPVDIELIFVDDGSSDQTSRVIRQYLFKHIKRVKLVCLSRNYGSHAAIRAGIEQAAYDVCTWLGSDLQEPLELLQMGYERLKSGLDAVYFEKKSVQVSKANRLFSNIYSKLMKKFVVQSYGSGGISTIVFGQVIKQYLLDFNEKNSSIMLQIMQAGYRYEVIPLEYKARAVGQSKWTTQKKVRLFVDSFVSFTNAPLKWVTGAGIVMFVGGCVLGLIVINQRLFNANPVSGYATLACLLAIGFGVTNISLGIVSEYLWRIFDAARGLKPYLVQSVTAINQEDIKQDESVYKDS